MSSAGEAAPHCQRSGFSLVELIIAIVILAFGVLSMASTSTWLVRQVTLSRLTTERTTARQSAVEGILARPYATIAGGSDTIGNFNVVWVATDRGSFKIVQLITVGPGRPPGATGMTLSPNLADTIVVTVPSPGF